MTTVTGILSAIYENEKSDALVVDGKKITVFKGTGTTLNKLRGAKVSIEVKEGEFNGKPTLSSDVKKVSLLEPAPAKAASNNNLVDNSIHSDQRTESILAQSMAKVAVEFTKYTCQMTDEQQQAEFKRLLKSMYSLARIAAKPDLFRPNPVKSFDTTAKPAASQDDYSDIL